MPVDPEIATLLDLLASLPRLETLSPAGARQVVAAMSAAGPPGPEIASVEDRSIDTPDGPLALRIYTGVAAPAAVLVYYHGGGWTLGGLGGSDAMLRNLALAAAVCIVSVDYRLAPEHPFPAAVDDAVAALRWAAGLGAPLLVGGDSAGANLATVAAIIARDAGGPALAGQLLFYPVTDADFETVSYRDNAEGYFLTRPMMRWFWDQYCPGAEARADWRASPLRASDLSRLPPALIQTAEFDPLRDEGEAYADRLRAAGNDVTLRQGPGLIHGYVGMAQAAAARTAIDDAVAWLRRIAA